MKKLLLILLFFSFPFFSTAQNTGDILKNLPKDEFQIREIANDHFLKQDYDGAVQVFLQGRKIMGNEQLFSFELLSLYRYKRDKANLVQEYLNILLTSPQMLQQAQNVFASIFEDNADYVLLQSALLKRMQKHPDHEAYAKLLTWQYLQIREYQPALQQLIAQDKRTKDDGAALYQYIQFFLSDKAYDIAIKAYNYLLLKGPQSEYYLPSKIGITDAKYQLLNSGRFDEKDMLSLRVEYQEILKQYGTNVNTLFALRRMAQLESQYLSHPQEAEQMLEKAISIAGLPPHILAEIKLELGDIYVLTGKPWEAILLYGQVAQEFEGQDISNEAKYRGARLSFFQGNFSYAKSQADVLKASTTQLIANDALNLSLMLSDHLHAKEDTLALQMYASADMLQFCNQLKAANQKLDSINLKYPGNGLHDDVLMLKSQIYIKVKEFDLAATALKSLLASPQSDIWTDDALFTLAGLYENQLGKTEEAKGLYQKLISDFPGSMYVAEARQHFRKLRGDNIES